MTRTVGEVADLASVTVRTLHHYDEIGLVRPSGRTAAGYRLYDAADLDRLQQVLFYRELGFGLEEIRLVMSDPGFDRLAALREQRKLLTAERGRVQAMLDAVEAAIDAHERGTRMSDEEMFEVFGEDVDPRGHEEEVRERWGGTDAYRQSAERTRRYTKTDWEAIRDEAQAVTLRMAELLDAGAAPTGPEAMDAAEAHREHIARWFYECSDEMHAALGEMYVEDPRFAATYERVRPGLAQYVRDATVANARHPR